ncbi:hypothetical protein [Clostridium folliculivorans]|uniref:Uncharacterized protein n=1 Tax=Clostridium folliculivorans TaxID=2886038 RepID=A0A9W5Y408_9CLOT|nr:hypothetical protein [Clostridium folliculivorans]GKU26052.1 hypothetical protein CFOLD11_28790 [Clostridium folliculivorans]GKU28138.1 hypothetical protein CFB3_02440 [Clostridium folliculivorans]
MESSRERGCLITGILVLYFIGAIFSVFTFPINKLNQTLSPELSKQFATSNTSMAIATVLGVMTVVAIIGVFLWNKIAIYAFIGLGVAHAINTFVSGGITGMTLLSAAISVAIPGVIGYVLIKRLSEDQSEEEL